MTPAGLRASGKSWTEAYSPFSPSQPNIRHFSTARPRSVTAFIIFSSLTAHPLATTPTSVTHASSTTSTWATSVGFDANDGQSGIFFYDFASNHFFYTSPSFPFPFLYDFNLNTVLYYYPDPSHPGHYTTNPRYFYNFATGQIITM
jgi:hypothetical protein